MPRRFCRPPKRIPCRTFVEIGHCALGRGGAVGAGRELPAHPRISALTSTASFIGGRGLNVLLPTPTAGAQSRPGAACSNRNAQRFNRDAARHVATKTIHAAFMVVLVSVGHMRGGGCGVSPSANVYAHAGIHREGVEEDNDAARRVATSFGERENPI